MARERIKIRKIDNITARQVTFSKRRRGILKKAQELSILCDADIALIIFSATGKLFDFSNSRMKDVLARYTTQSNNEEMLQQQPLSLNQELENCNLANLNREIANKNEELRKLRGEDLKGMGFEELLQLERMLEGSLSRVIDTKRKRIDHEIERLQNQGGILMEENKLLKQKMIALSKGGKAVILGHHSDTTAVHEEGQSSESITNNGGGPLTEDDSSDTSLKLGL